MAVLALLYKKKEPLWALASDIIQNAFHGRRHHYPDMEMPRLANFKPADPQDARRFCQEFEEKKKDSYHQLAIEFHKIKTDTQQYLNNRNTTFGLQADVRHKNRYRDVVPYDHNRVRLASSPGNEVLAYINASNIKNPKGEVSFIATQGPTKETYEDFFCMLIEKGVKIVVTIISSINIEEGMQKRQCYQYWPRAVGASEPQGRFLVHLEAEFRRSSFVNRMLKIIGPTGTTHRFNQLHYFEWKDHRIPNNPDDLISFLSVFRRAREPGTIPVVHCSAGVGRTGTFIALDFLMDSLQAGVRIDVAEMVKYLRSQRMLMVQTEEQYIFLYECLNTLLRRQQQQQQSNHHTNNSNNHRTSAGNNIHKSSGHASSNGSSAISVQMI
ncbi:receptor-type tyrosine-protein phosphatase alpha-like [Varroa jacobsoni]|uniref:Uncharacterized protein n=1 Tax=Varroa destructor TaxID=109461 RepID=A0A7M7JXJ1_VARDE|nr:receptor-type tyrosine-protein phosphatase alpha-like [Varroa destructor]XP_022658011.1 receptor-type tyrosine-protein phosphatase alpha-like [Varroa destructor]XP_022658012.1 receptor-type tyrosine-protein phosphatase alpha-like [Varroa destructor]XP_022658013.1 receptor-type tyrosine-protein phosphatase alpha-like [Varroa destructor]XP_022658014.1 receptor-type tyrosine-protein phosphatase alpha-like [Varroa destructor]XP_022658016.1 receptor-type tyrosine-protein phosphatase alpha-like [